VIIGIVTIQLSGKKIILRLYVNILRQIEYSKRGLKSQAKSTKYYDDTNTNFLSDNVRTHPSKMFMEKLEKALHWAG